MNSDIDNTNLEPSGDFAQSIRDFRSAVTHVAERETASPVTAGWLAPARKRRRDNQQTMALSWACAALLCFATLPFSSHSRHQAPVSPIATVPTEPSAESDTALLEQVDTDVSESVPSPLAPLADLDNWDTASANPSSGSDNGTTLRRTESTNVAQ